MGALGLFARVIPASVGVLFPLRLLQATQAITTLFQLCFPPFERGIIWSIVKSFLFPEYWH